MLATPSSLIDALYGTAGNITARRHRGRIVIHRPAQNDTDRLQLEPTPHTLTLQQGTDAYSGCTDNGTISFYPNHNNGGSQYAHVLNANIGGTLFDYRTLLRFELPPIPTILAVTAATLTVNLLDVGYYGYHPNVPIRSARLNRTWGEGTKTYAPASSGESTYASSQHAVQLWTAPNANNETSDRQPPSGSFTITSLPQAATFDVTQDVHDFYLVPTPNYGWLLWFQSYCRHYCNIYSRNHVTTAMRPSLTFDYTTLP